MNPRRLTILRSKSIPSNRAKDGSSLFLNGQWLKAAGFLPGSKVSIYLDHGRMLIEVQQPPAQARLDGPLAQPSTPGATQ